MTDHGRVEEMTRTFLAIVVSGLLGASVAFAQPLGAGLKIGAPLTSAFTNRTFPSASPFAPFSASSSDYTIGPYVELRLPYQMAIEADALYRKYEFSNAGIGSSTSNWEFPIVLKHKFGPPLVKPYFEGGLSFSHLSDIKTVSVNHFSNYGIVVGGGVQVNVLLLKISPEIRYTGWWFKNFDGLAESKRNQVVFLVGFGF